MKNSFLFSRRSRCSFSVVALLVLVQCGDATTLQNNDTSLAPPQALTQSCNLSGTWGIKFSIPVKWPSSLVVLPGKGAVYQWIKATRTQTGHTLNDTMNLCGISSPDSKTRPIFRGESYGITFPNELFDSGKLPSFAAVTQLDGDAQPGSTYTTEPLTVLIGMTMENGRSGSWPNAKVMTTLDQDDDGKPGITIDTRRDKGYTPPPVNMFGTKRAAKFYVALRNVVESAQGTFSDCDHASGRVTIPVIDGKLAINSRILGCERIDGGNCVPSEYEMIDKQSSGYSLDGDATMELVRLPDDATCDAVRAM